MRKILTMPLRLGFLTVLLGVTACGTTRQNVQLSGSAASIPHWVKFAAAPLVIAECRALSAKDRDTFDSELRGELSRSDMLATSATASDADLVWRLKPRCVSFERSGGVDNKLMATSGDARLVIEMAIFDEGNTAKGSLRATETRTVNGLYPKLADQPFGAVSATTLAEQLRARSQTSFD